MSRLYKVGDIAEPPPPLPPPRPPPPPPDKPPATPPSPPPGNGGDGGDGGGGRGNKKNPPPERSEVCTALLFTGVYDNWTGEFLGYCTGHNVIVPCSSPYVGGRHPASDPECR